jgi:hypothetical protein
MSQIGAVKPAAAPTAATFDSMKTQKLPGNSERTQRLTPDIETTQQIDVKADAPAPGTTPDAETTQRIDDSIWRLQEAKRILQGINQK